MKPAIFDPEILENGKSKWEKHRDICLSIVKELQNYPCSYLYEKPVECQTLDNQTKTLSFPLIIDHINDNTYTEIKEWMSDMRLLLYTQVKNYKHKSEYVVLFEFIHRFVKKIKRFNLTSLKSWIKTMLDYKLKIDTLLQTAPPSAQKYFPTNIPQIEYKTKRLELSQRNYILENFQRIQDPNDIHSILNIIRLDVNGTEPDNGLLDIDLYKLAMPTKCKIYDFMKTRLKDNEEDHALKI